MSAPVTAWMPLYVGDYLADTQRLTTEQHGAYLLLILDYWRNGPAPDDDDVLQQITKLERARWRKHRPILAKLFRIEDGHWRHKRIDAEIVGAKENAERRSSRAKKAAEARWGDTNSNATSNAQSMPDALLGECPPPSPSPSPKEEGESPPTSENAREPKIRLVEPADPPKNLPYAFAGRVIRLSRGDFDRWVKLYGAIPDLSAELGALDDWFRSQDEATCKRWFHIVSRALAKKHATWLADAKRADDGDWEMPVC